MDKLYKVLTTEWSYRKFQLILLAFVATAIVLKSYGINIERMNPFLVLLIISCVWAFVAGYRKNGNRRSGLYRAYLQAEQNLQGILNQGREGEDILDNKLQTLRAQMDILSQERTWMPKDDGIQEIVLLTGERTPSKEVDNLIATKDYVFVIEVKSWKGQITQKNGTFYQDGKEIKSPEKQTMDKVRMIEECLSNINHASTEHHHCKVIPVYVFTHKHVELDPNLPHNYIPVSALPSLMTYYRDLYQKKPSTLSLSQVKEALLTKMSREEHPKYQHMLRLAEYTSDPSEDIKWFKQLHEIKLERQAALQQVPSGLISNVKNAVIYTTVAAAVCIGLAAFAKTVL